MMFINLNKHNLKWKFLQKVTRMKFPASKVDRKFATNGLLICADCGSINTKVRSEGIYCTECKLFLLYHNSINLQQIILAS